MPWYRYSALLFLVLVAYVATGLWGLSLHPVSGFAALVWPPTGIALAALYFFGLRIWPAVALGAFLINTFTGAPLWAAGLIAVGNTLEVVGGAYALRFVFDFNPLFRRLRDTLTYIFLCVLCPFIAASIGTLALFFAGIVPYGEITLTWSAWWIGDALGALIIGAFLIRWFAKPLFTRTAAQWAELFAAFSLLIAANLVTIANPIPILRSLPMAYFFVPLLWLSIRAGARAVTLASLVVAGFLIFETVYGVGLFVQQPAPQNLFLSQILMGILATIFLVIGGAIEERRGINALLKKNVIELERALRRLRGADKAKNEFITILAHELRNPLAPIVTSLELLALNKDEGDEHRALRERMTTSAETIRTLLDDLLDISRISRRSFRLQKSRIDLLQTIRSSVASVSGLMRERGHSLSVSLPEEPLFANADPIRLEQVFVNILNNAGKYTENGGRIALSCTQIRKEALIEIRDTGIGIAPERLPYIFEPFQRSSASQARSGGLGIGLSLAHRLLKLHGGSVEADSPGERMGSTFTVRVPLPESDQLSVALPQAKRAVASPAFFAPPFRIVVIDDNEAAATSLATLLEIRGHEVRIAFSGSDGIEKILGHKPDLAIVDIGLPDIDGYEVARTLRRKNAAPRLIALSGYGQDEDRQKAYAAGFDHHITKPAGLSDIEKILRKIRSSVPVEPFGMSTANAA